MGYSLLSIDWREGPTDYTGTLKPPEEWEIDVSNGDSAVLFFHKNAIQNRYSIDTDHYQSDDYYGKYIVDTWSIQSHGWKVISVHDSIAEAYAALMAYIYLGLD